MREKKNGERNAKGPLDQMSQKVPLLWVTRRGEQRGRERLAHIHTKHH